MGMELERSMRGAEMWRSRMKRRREAVTREAGGKARNVKECKSAKEDRF